MKSLPKQAIVSRKALQEYELSLIRLGGRRLRRPPAASQLIVWQPENAGTWTWVDASDWDYCEAVVSCLKLTQPGTRAFAYQCGNDGSVVGVVDFQGPALSSSHWGYVAPGVFRPFPHALSRARLGAQAELASLFGTRGAPRRGQRLSDSQTQAIARALEPARLPSFIAMPGKNCGELEWRRANAAWGREEAMRTAIVQSRSQVRKLFKRRPERESPSAIGHERYDLISYTENIVAELKLAATTATLRQLDRYLATLGCDRGGRWAGHIVYGNSCSPQLIAEVRARRNVSLWRCDDGPRLEKEG